MFTENNVAGSELPMFIIWIWVVGDNFERVVTHSNCLSSAPHVGVFIKQRNINLLCDFWYLLCYPIRILVSLLLYTILKKVALQIAITTTNLD